MKVSAHNILKGKVTMIVTGAIHSGVSLVLPGGTRIRSMITNEPVKTLELKEGQGAYAVIKASEVMIAVE